MLPARLLRFSSPKIEMKNFRIVTSTVQFVAAERCEVRPDKVSFCLSDIVVKSYHSSEVKMVEELDSGLKPTKVLYSDSVAHGIAP
jgi:hypothetical protein